jgi:hypothetical protein
MPDAKAELRIETVPNPGRQSSRTAFRSASGMFAKKPKAPSAIEVQRQTAAKLTHVTPDKPKSDYELMVEAMTQLAQHPDEKTASAAVKAFEALSKAAGFLEKQPEKQQSLQVIITHPNLPNEGEFIPAEKRVPLRPHFSEGETPYLQGEVVQQNPAPAQAPEQKPKQTLAQLQSEYDKL